MVDIISFCNCIHPVSVRRFPSFRTQPLESLKTLPMNKWVPEQPSPWRKSCKRESCYGDRVYGDSATTFHQLCLLFDLVITGIYLLVDLSLFIYLCVCIINTLYGILSKRARQFLLNNTTQLIYCAQRLYKHNGFINSRSNRFPTPGLRQKIPVFSDPAPGKS